jgi:outer membrane protein assembly factor BamE (lipoprotein component of BamABCDE complex)
MNRNFSVAVLSTAIAALPFAMTGCLAGHHSSSSIEGAYVQPSDLSRVKKNVSTTDDVMQILGAPTEKYTHDDGTETWSWNWTRKERDSGHVIFIFHGSSDKEVDESAHVTFEYGVAVKKWRD